MRVLVRRFSTHPLCYPFRSLCRRHNPSYPSFIWSKLSWVELNCMYNFGKSTFISCFRIFFPSSNRSRWIHVLLLRWIMYSHVCLLCTPCIIIIVISSSTIWNCHCRWCDSCYTFKPFAIWGYVGSLTWKNSTLFHWISIWCRHSFYSIDSRVTRYSSTFIFIDTLHLLDSQ